MDDTMHSSFMLLVSSLFSRVPQGKVIVPTAQEGKIAASCSVPAFTVAANRKATRTAILSTCITRLSELHAFAKKTATGDVLARNMAG
jgi:hypothetical protein